MNLRAVARQAIPAVIYRRGSRAYRSALECAGRVQLFVRFGRPDMVLFFGVALGDDLLCTTVLRELRKRGRGPLWMMSNHPELFQGAGDAVCVVPVDARYERMQQYRFLEYARIDPQADRSEAPARHIIAELCARVGISGQVDLRPHLKLTEAEKTDAVWAAGSVAVQSAGLGARWPMKNKEWFPERFQAVVDQLLREVPVVQLGSPGDPPLAGARDLRGKTSPRQTAAILSHAQLYLGNVGFLMHLARAVECPAVILYGGREAPWQSGYSGNVNLYSAMPCAPCWLWNTCNFDRACMDQITVSDVVQAAHRQMQRPRGPLPVDTILI